MISRIISKLLPLTELIMRNERVYPNVFTYADLKMKVMFTCKAFVTTTNNLICKEVSS